MTNPPVIRIIFRLLLNCLALGFPSFLSAQVDSSQWRLLDIGSVFLDEQGELTRAIMPDLLHPGAEGYRRLAQAIEPEVAAALGDAPVTE